MSPLLLLTRPRESSAESATEFEALGFQTVTSPLIEFELRAKALPDPSEYKGLVFTSANGARAFMQLYKAPAPAIPVFTVGEHTAETVKGFGFTQTHSADGDLSALQHLIEKTAPRDPLLYPCSENRTGELQPRGVTITTLPIYRMAKTRSLTPEAEFGLKSGDISAVALYSRRTAESFLELAAPLLEIRGARPLAAICLSANIAQVLNRNRIFHIYLASSPNQPSMLAAAKTVLNELKAQHQH